MHTKLIPTFIEYTELLRDNNNHAHTMPKTKLKIKNKIKKGNKI